jgi:AraC-like DNA-binding protein
MEPAAVRETQRTIAGCYREFAPHPALVGHVRAFFSFGPRRTPAPVRRRVTYEALFDTAERAPRFADANASIVFELTSSCDAHGLWRSGDGRARARMIGAMSRVDPEPAGDVPAMVGAYLHPAQVSRFTRVTASELTDRVVALEELWGTTALDLQSQISELEEDDGVDRLESELLRRADGRQIGAATVTVNVERLAALVLERGGRLTVEELAFAAGVSRQQLGRVFRDRVGVAPKLFCRLARFQAALAYAQRGTVNWAQAAAALGYADQSHMIAELREFSSLTPARLAGGSVFHPFLERARRARTAASLLARSWRAKAGSGASAVRTGWGKTPASRGPAESE